MAGTQVARVCLAELNDCYPGAELVLKLQRLMLWCGSTGCDGPRVVQEFVLAQDGNWLLAQSNIRIGDKKIFAPANLRAAADNKAYHDLVMHWISEQYTLRYTGGMVPDVHHILSKVRLL